MSSAQDQASRQPGYFHAVAIDYDGTLSTTDRPASDVLAALAETRAAGRRVVLVTGRILSDLRVVFPDVDRHFDLIVAENGGVLSSQGVERVVAVPVAKELDDALAERHVPFRRGLVLLACEGHDERAVLAQVRRLGLECQLIRNRGALMVLPSGISKGSGLLEALADLGISRHNTIAIGDAENDHSLLDVSELGVAPANAVDALRNHADITLDLPDGAGVASFLRDRVIAGVQRVHPTRWRLELGTLADGTSVWVPASQLNMLIVGRSGAGKSYVAGLVAEQLIQLGYSVLVVDPEGDHIGLVKLRGVSLIGGSTQLPPAEQLSALLTNRPGSVVVDLSTLPPMARAEYLRAAPQAVESQRQTSGLPHWVIVDEAHDALGRADRDPLFLEPGLTGYCLATYRPDDLPAEALLSTDVLLTLMTNDDVASTIDLIAAASVMSHSRTEEIVRTVQPGQAVLVDRRRAAPPVVFNLAPRTTAHHRHWHKYALGGVAWNRRFYFRSGPDRLTGATAGSVEELERELRGCDEAVISHHSRNGDLSRWIALVLRDPPLASAVSVIEADVAGGGIDGRERLLRAIHEHYPE
jgi:hydroxymethylpyrimidine pyrophosphatase-like HAD family hydrolase